MTSEQTKTKIQNFWKFLAQRNLENAGEYIAEDYQYHGPGGVEASGVNGFKEMLSAYFAAFPDLTFHVHDLLCEGDRAASRFTATGTHEGELMGLAPTGKRISFGGLLVARIANGKIAEEWESLDELSMLQQLGAIPAG